MKQVAATYGDEWHPVIGWLGYWVIGRSGIRLIKKTSLEDKWHQLVEMNDTRWLGSYGEEFEEENIGSKWQQLLIWKNSLEASGSNLWRWMTDDKWQQLLIKKTSLVASGINLWRWMTPGDWVHKAEIHLHTKASINKNIIDMIRHLYVQNVKSESCFSHNLEQ